MTERTRHDATPRRPRGLARITLAALFVSLAACSSNSRSVSTTSTTAPESAPRPSQLSVVQIGDSIAAGEGTLYGFTYDRKSRTWVGGNPDAVWPEPYPECHDSPYAFGELVSAAFGADFSQFACTGASFDNGITRAETYNGTSPLRPAQFGNWDTRTDLNPDYDTAAPDVVLLTFGADDVHFVKIFEGCVLNAFAHDVLKRLDPLECVEGNPGATATKDFLDDKARLAANYGTLVGWINARAKANRARVPEIFITTYPNPLPPADERCPDVEDLDPKQVAYLSRLLDDLNGIIKTSVASLEATNPNVHLADTSGVYMPDGVSHRWCSEDPWAYGLSIIDPAHPATLEVTAPFHPTPRGQQAFARVVTPLVAKATGRTTGESESDPGR